MPGRRTKAEIEEELEDMTAVRDQIADVLEDEDLNEQAKLDEIDRLIFGDDEAEE